MNMSPSIALLAVQFTLGVGLGGALAWIYVRRKRMQGAPSGFCLSDADPTAEIEEGYWGLYGTWKEAAEVRHELIAHRLRDYYEDIGEGEIPRRDHIEILPVWIGTPPLPSSTHRSPRAMSDSDPSWGTHTNFVTPGSSESGSASEVTQDFDGWDVPYLTRKERAAEMKASLTDLKQCPECGAWVSPGEECHGMRFTE